MRGVADHDHVAGQPLALAPQQAGEVLRAGLLLALHDQLDRDRRRRRAARGQAGADAERVEQHLALVVGGAPGQQQAVALGGLERRAVPLLQRLDRLDVVVPVDQDDRGARVGGGPLGEDGGQPVRAVSQTSATGKPMCTQVHGEPFGAEPHVAVPLGVGGDRRDRQPLLQVVDELARVGLDVRADIHA